MTLSPTSPTSLNNRRYANAPQAQPAAQPLRHPLTFGRAEFSSRDRVPDDVYTLLTRAPKNEIHVHQGGSSSVEFLSYRLRMAIEKNQAAYDEWASQRRNKILPKLPQWAAKPIQKMLGGKSPSALASPGNSFNGKILDELPVFQEGAPPKMVRFTDANGKPLPAPQLRAAKEEALTLDNLRNYYRYSLTADNQKYYMDSKDIAETTARHSMQSEMISATESAEMEKRKAEGLKAYRLTSGKINPFVKNLPAFYKLANEYARTVADENVRYTEYRVSPSGNGIGGANGSNIEDVLSSVYRGFEDAKQQLNQRMKGFDYGLIVLFERQNRSANEPQDMKVQRAKALAQQVVALKEQGLYNICGVDLAGDEANNPVTEFKEAFDIIKEYNRKAAPENRLGITIHAGETPTSHGPVDKLQGFQSIEKAIEVAEDSKTRGSGLTTPVRIGHGLQIVNSSEALRQAFEIYRQHPEDWESRINVDEIRKQSPLLDKVIQDKIVLEMCPKSNLQTYGIHPGFPNEQFSVQRSDYSAEAYRRHPAVFLSRLGVKVAISSDNRTISNTDVTNEFVKLFKYAGLTYGDFKQMVMNGFEGAFVADPAKKQAIIQDVNKQFERLEHDPDARQAIAMMNDNTRQPIPVA